MKIQRSFLARKQLEFQALQAFIKCLNLSESPLSVSGGEMVQWLTVKKIC